MKANEIQKELKQLPLQKRKNKLNEIPRDHIEYVITKSEAENLVELYIDDNAITRKYYED